MLFSRVVVALALLSFAVPADAKTAPARKTASPTKTAKTSDEYVSSERLLLRSYLLSKELPPEERVWLLTEILLPSAKWHPAMMRPWTEEVFRLALQLSPGYDRVVTQKNAATAMAWIDERRAMQMLDQCEIPSPSDSDAEDVRDDAAITVFKRYWDANAFQGLPRIQRTADHLGDTGQYPYEAMIPIVLEAKVLNPAKALSLINEAFAYFQRGSPFVTSTEQFVEFYKRVKPLLTAPMQREALEAIVNDLTAGPGGNENQRWRTRVYTSQGVADFHSRNTKLLFDILPMIRELDPEWAQRLVEQNHELAQADAAQGKLLSAEGGVIITNPDNPPSSAELSAKEQSLLELGRLDQIQEMALKDPNQALTLAMSISDPGRHAMGMAYAAAGFGNKPDQALTMLKQSQDGLSSLKKDNEKLETYAAIAESAASLHDPVLVRDAVEKGLDLGEQAYAEASKEHPEWHVYEFSGMGAMERLAEMGMRTDARHVIGRIETIRDHALQAYMLVSAARGIDEKKSGGWPSLYEGV
jgi:hypothetical protein